MLASDLTIDASTAIAAGTAGSITFSLLGGNVNQRSTRTVASLATTNPRAIQIAHSVRTEKGFKTVANQSVPAPDIVFDRHLVRMDSNIIQSLCLDPNARVNQSIQIVIETPRLGASSPTPTNLMDNLLALVAMLRASSNANFIRILNNET